MIPGGQAMSSIRIPISANRLPDEEIPPLENGDRLNRAEFERRYEAMPGVKKVLDVLREGIASPEHVAFVKELAARRGSSRPINARRACHGSAAIHCGATDSL